MYWRQFQRTAKLLCGELSLFLCFLSGYKAKKHTWTSQGPHPRRAGTSAPGSPVKRPRSRHRQRQPVKLPFLQSIRKSVCLILCSAKTLAFWNILKCVWHFQKPCLCKSYAIGLLYDFFSTPKFIRPPKLKSLRITTLEIKVPQISLWRTWRGGGRIWMMWVTGKRQGMGWTRGSISRPRSRAKASANKEGTWSQAPPKTTCTKLIIETNQTFCNKIEPRTRAEDLQTIRKKSLGFQCSLSNCMFISMYIIIIILKLKSRKLRPKNGKMFFLQD